MASFAHDGVSSFDDSFLESCRRGSRGNIVGQQVVLGSTRIHRRPSIFADIHSGTVLLFEAFALLSTEVLHRDYLCLFTGYNFYC